VLEISLGTNEKIVSAVFGALRSWFRPAIPTQKWWLAKACGKI